jgi:DNA anti-recombination protein RmuC
MAADLQINNPEQLRDSLKQLEDHVDQENQAFTQLYRTVNSHIDQISGTAAEAFWEHFNNYSVAFQKNLEARKELGNALLTAMDKELQAHQDAASVFNRG